MSTKSDVLVSRAEIGGRVKEIRSALGMTGDQFAAELTRASKLFGYAARYTKYKVSKIEGGGRNLTAQEVAILSQLDPDEDHGAIWLVFGDDGAKVRLASASRFKRIAGESRKNTGTK